MNILKVGDNCRILNIYIIIFFGAGKQYGWVLINKTKYPWT